MTLERIIQFIADLVKNKFTGRLIIDIHNGDISKRVRKEVIEVLDEHLQKQYKIMREIE